MMVGPLFLPRHKTAIWRHKLSRPIVLALSHGLMSNNASFLDYGCGHGEDVRLLKQDGFVARGWDPHFQPDLKPAPAAIVNLGYVLNVIENLQERQETLRKAYAFAERLLIVSVRVDQSLEGGMPLADGVVTNSGAFQKLYTQPEFRAYLEQVLGVHPIMASLGVAYIFKDSTLESSFLSTMALGRPQAWRQDVLNSFRKDRIAQRFVKAGAALGRLPLPEEFRGYEKLAQRFGSPMRIARLAQALFAESDVEEVRRNRRVELLLYLAMTRLQGLKAPPFRILPAPIQADIKALWPTYQAAQAEGDQFLFQMGKPEVVRSAIAKAGIGKLMSDALYFHRSSTGQVPPLIRLILFAAEQIVGDVEHELVKLDADGRKISFLRYSRFDEEAHPALEYSVRVHLPTATHSFRDYRDSTNPPVLHRKDTLVDPLYPRYAEFRALSEQEHAMGLLSRKDIGFRRQWLALLAEKGVRIDGHALIQASQNEGGEEMG
jgi:DNA phosphorothioation-associated putative methyltransferase